MDDVSTDLLLNVFLVRLIFPRIGDTDYLILYAPEDQTGETGFLLSTKLKVSNLQDAPGATATFSDGRLTLQYTLKGSQFIPIQLQSTKFVVILLDKATAYQWHAPIIEGSGTFGNFFSIGTNETSVFCRLFTCPEI